MLHTIREPQTRRLKSAWIVHDPHKGGRSLLVRQNDRQKVMEIWLTKEDQENAVFMDGLNAKYEEWKQQGYLPVVYRSGSEPLFDCTLDLLKHNRKVSARSEAR